MQTHSLQIHAHTHNTIQTESKHDTVYKLLWLINNTQEQSEIYLILSVQYLYPVVFIFYS